MSQAAKRSRCVNRGGCWVGGTRVGGFDAYDHDLPSLRLLNIGLRLARRVS